MVTILSVVLTTLLAGQAPTPGPNQKTVPSQASISPAGADALVNTNWRLVAVGDLTPSTQPGARVPHLAFTASGGISGYDGCNTFRGSYTAGDETITFVSVMGTLMTCAPGDSLDRRFRDALGKARSWKVVAGTLTLLDEKGTALARFDATLE